jgi:ligand-binding sensor domain-containing protein
MRLKNTILLFLFVFFTSGLYSQIYNFRVFGVDEGLPQSYVYSISQNKTGFINVATGEGFCSFEGSKFKVFSTKDNLAENFVTTHYTDSRGIIWLGHYQKGISYLINEKFASVKLTSDIASKVTSIAEDKSRNIWFSTQSKGLYRIDSLFKPAAVDSKNDEGSNAICFDNAGLLMEGSDKGLFIYRLGRTGKILTLVQELKELSGKNIKCLVPVNKVRDAFWIAVDEMGIVGIEKKGEKYSVFTVISSELNLKDYTFSSLFVDQKENLWAGDFGEGIRKISFYDVNNKSSFAVNKIDDRNGLPNEYIQSIYEDYEGNMWFGSFGSGLVELPLEKFAFFEVKNGLTHKNATCVFIDREGVFWEGNDKGLFQFNIDGSELSRQFDASNGFINAEVNSMAQDRSGLLWIGTKENGIYTYDKKKNIFQNFSKKKQLSATNINSLISTTDNRIVIATSEGVYIYDQKKDDIRHLTTLDGLLHNNVTKVFEDNKKRMWFCSNGAGPYFLKDNEFNVFNNIPELRSFNITTITQSADGTVWIGTEGDGVFSYNERGGFINYKVTEGLFSNYCYFIISDKNGNIWAGHKNGLSYKPAHLKTFRTYSKSDGLLFTEFNRNACFRDISGNLWLGTANGLIKYNAEGENRIQAEPKTNIAGLMLNNTFYKPDQTIEVPYDDYSVKVDYIAISFTDPAKVNFKYRLIGQDTIWRYTNSK